jgi:uncharacterized membrane-anchored protein
MAVIFLSIITLGIYDLFWLVKVKKELNAKTSVHVPSMWLLMAPLLLFFVGFVATVVALSISASSSEEAAKVVNVVTLLAYIVAGVAILPITFYWFFKFSKAVNQYTNKELNTAVTFLLLWMLRFIGIAVLQDHFNDMLEAGNASPPAAGAAFAAPATSAVQTWQTPPQQPMNPQPAVPQQPQEQPQPPQQQPPASPAV